MMLSEALLALVRLEPTATVILTREGKIVAANALARDALGLGQELDGAHIHELVVESRDHVDDYLRLCSRSTELLPGALSVQRRASAPVSYASKGALVAARSDATPPLIVLRFEPKDVAGNQFILLSQTVAELTTEVQRRRSAEESLRRSEASLRERALEAEAANRLKDEFLATLSHELRTPMNAILGWTKMIRDGVLSDERRERAMDTIERNARMQVHLIEELLDISRIVTGKLRMNVQQIEPVQFIEAAVEIVRPAADAKGVKLQVVLDPQAGPVHGDPDRLQQVLWNLLNNALKFTPKGGRIQVVLERINSSVEISVIDTGRGIRPEFLPHVFERFRQEEGTTTRTVGGLGLGLSIAKSLVELHGGSLRAHSEGEGQGATFVVRLPRALIRAKAIERPFASVAISKSDSECPPEIAGLRVVIVDDEPDALELLGVMLEMCGAQVKSALSAAQALEIVKSTLPDILISDIGMPGEDGYELLRKVRALPPTAGGRTPAIALTAFARSIDRTRALTAGFHSHVPKPVEPAELLAVIASVVARNSPLP